MQVLVDSSAWIAYFKGGDATIASRRALNYLIDGNETLINEIILAELLPSIRLRKETELEGLLRLSRQLPLSIDWENIYYLAEQCLRHGINGMGIPDLVIAQQAISNKIPLFTIDRHFKLLKEISALTLLPN